MRGKSKCSTSHSCSLRKLMLLIVSSWVFMGCINPMASHFIYQVLLQDEAIVSFESEYKKITGTSYTLQDEIGNKDTYKEFIDFKRLFGLYGKKMNIQIIDEDGNRKFELLNVMKVKNHLTYRGEQDLAGNLWIYMSDWASVNYHLGHFDDTLSGSTVLQVDETSGEILFKESLGKNEFVLCVRGNYLYTYFEHNIYQRGLDNFEEKIQVLELDEQMKEGILKFDIRDKVLTISGVHREYNSEKMETEYVLLTEPAYIHFDD